MKPRRDHTRDILQALAAAALFGLGTPLAKLLLGTTPSLLLAGLLYAGSGLGLSLWLVAEHPDTTFWLAGALMALGVWLHVSERHAHEHVHEALAHNHRHYHDEHHQHAHDFPWDGKEPHTHPHLHEPLVHSHPHYPDIHHRHRHS